MEWIFYLARVCIELLWLRLGAGLRAIAVFLTASRNRSHNRSATTNSRDGQHKRMLGSSIVSI